MDLGLTADELEVAVAELTAAAARKSADTALGGARDKLAHLLRQQRALQAAAAQRPVAPETGLRLSSDEVEAYALAGQRLCLDTLDQNLPESVHHRLWCLIIAIRKRLIYGGNFNPHAIDTPEDRHWTGLLLAALKAAYLCGTKVK